MERYFRSTPFRRDDISEVKVTDRLSMKDKNVLITGGARGIGFAIAKAVAQLGGNVAVIDYQEKPIQEFSSLKDRYGIDTFYTQADVTQKQSLDAAFEKAVKAQGAFHGCVPAAGIALDKPIRDTTWDEAKRVLDVNVMGTFWTTKLTADHMREHRAGGSIVMIASIAAQGFKVPNQELSIYNMSKAAVKGLAGPLAVELSGDGIRVNTISPGVILSPMTKALEQENPQLLKMFEQSIPLKRLGVPQDLTPAVTYLLSDASSYTTGADFLITGGIHAGTAPAWTARGRGW